MIAHVSKWVLPVSGPPIRDGAVVVQGGRIAAVGPAAEVLTGFSGLICEHGDGAILPGVVNCHVHLEFSALAGSAAQACWEDWLEATLAASRARSPGGRRGRHRRSHRGFMAERRGSGGGGDQHRGPLAVSDRRPVCLPPVLRVPGIQPGGDLRPAGGLPLFRPA